MMVRCLLQYLKVGLKVDADCSNVMVLGGEEGLCEWEATETCFSLNTQYLC